MSTGKGSLKRGSTEDFVVASFLDSSAMGWKADVILEDIAKLRDWLA